MEEDLLGPRRTVTGVTYDTCERCGRAVPRDQATALHVPGEGPSVVPAAGETHHPPEATQDGPPLILCPDCARDVAAGEPLGIPPRRP